MFRLASARGARTVNLVAQRKHDPEHYAKARTAFIAMKVATPAQRRLNQLPGTHREFAELWDISERVVEKWSAETREEVERLKRKAAIQAGATPARNTNIDLASMTREEKFALLVDRQIDLALTGDSKAIEFLRANQSITKPLTDALTAEFNTDFEGQSDIDLIEQLLDGFAPEVCAALERRGWTLTPPEVKR